MIIILGNVLAKPINAIGEANGHELQGELKDFMSVHSAKLKTTAKGEPIKSEKIGGRTTYYKDAQELLPDQLILPLLSQYPLVCLGRRSPLIFPDWSLWPINNKKGLLVSHV